MLDDEPAPGPPPPGVDALADALRADPSARETWRAYATALISAGDDFGPIVARGVLGEDIANSFVGLDPKVLLLGGLSRVGRVVHARWQRGLEITLDGDHPAPWLPVASLDTAFAFLRLTVESLQPSTLRSLRRMPRLQALRLENESLAELELEDLEQFGPLETLELSGFVLDDLEPLAAHATLQRLVLDGWWGTDDLFPLSALHALHALELTNCGALPDITDVVTVLGLKRLVLHGNDAITDIVPIGALAGLRSLTLYHLEQLTDLSPLASLEQLTSLTVGRLGTTDLQDLARLPALRSLTILDSAVDDLEPLLELEHLEALTLERCGALRRLGPLGRMQQLRALTLRRCRGIKALPRFRKRCPLEHVTLELCPAISDFTPLQALPHLQSVAVGPTLAEDPAPLLRLANLRELRLLTPALDEALVTALREQATGSWTQEGETLVLRV